MSLHVDWDEVERYQKQIGDVPNEKEEASEREPEEAVQTILNKDDIPDCGTLEVTRHSGRGSVFNY